MTKWIKYNTVSKMKSTNNFVRIGDGPGSRCLSKGLQAVFHNEIIGGPSFVETS